MIYLLAAVVVVQGLLSWRFIGRLKSFPSVPFVPLAYGPSFR